MAYIMGAGALGGALLLRRGIREARCYRVRRVNLSHDVSSLPSLKLLHVTDTHFDGRDEHLLRFLEGVAEDEEFDLVLYTGDLIHHGGGVESLRRMAEMFRPRMGSFAVLGGHDYVHVRRLRTYLNLVTAMKPDGRRPTNPVEQVKSALNHAGVHLLDDAHHVVQTPGGRRLALVGLRDAYLYTPSVESAWDGLPDETPVLALSHCPDLLPELARRGVDLAVFGHTHGGQIRLPLVGALVVRTRLPRRAARGVFRCRHTVASVSAGLGTSPACPVRLLCPPEAVVIETDCPAAECTAIRELRLG